LCPPEVRIERASAAELPFPAKNFDLVLQSTVFTSILDGAMKQQVASEMLRVVRSEGLILWYDFNVNNPWNPDVKGVKKREIARLFTGCHVDLRRITLAPPLARWIAPRSWLLACLLEKIPLLRTHYLAVIRKAM
jgi:ubiquinone/menaquinone biosynthesis C-methylase UbiE